ncbi:GNAT family N-acetyltransferase [Roseateles asaccharophilus]|uniref:GNAT superfamily N-acetyltransferase n=1 Tax=Roseateles asaccharophilus TaxID=582607 RepID=A0ABU2ABT2_9BURK|nr:GNAT family N-acetyltransferase [Roseateles asaccharophilus]MDR7334650.1 GNAT superfamily N-acetyltransferase [Roseateles asaccharophilus]
MLPTLAPVADADFEAMLSVRIEALRESLERLGRFNPDVARARLKSQFRPEWMRHLVVDGERVGYFTVEPRGGELRLHHLYLKPAMQGQGIGAWVLEQIKARGLPITLAALRESRANDFYLRHGFKVVEEQAFDIEYRWEVGA